MVRECTAEKAGPGLAVLIGRNVGLRKEMHMKTLTVRNDRERETGAIGYILLWLIGIPLPVILILFLLFR
jgi:hypothetical protein